MKLEEEIRCKLNNIQSDTSALRSSIRSVRDNLPGIGLYTMVFLGMIGGCTASSRVSDLQRELASFRRAYKQQVDNAQGYVLKVENVVGGEAKDVFLERDGQRYFLEIDGKNVREYVPRPSRDVIQPQVPR